MIERRLKNLLAGLLSVATLASVSTAIAQSAISAPVNLTPASFPKLYNTLSGAAERGSFPVAVLDINGDEMMDVFIGQGQGLNDLIAIQHPGEPWSVHSLDDNTEATLHTLVADLNHDFIDDLVVTRPGGVFIYPGSRRGGFDTAVQLPDSGHGEKVSTRQVIASDVNNDGWTDLYAVRGSDTGPGADNRLWINLGVTPEPAFREAALGARVNATGDNVGAVFADLDDDRDVDLVVTPRQGKMLVFANDGDGNFTSIPVHAPDVANVAGVLATDVDQDGDVDLLLTLKKSHLSGGLLLLDNEGNFSFGDVTRKSHLTINEDIQNAVWIDLNNDGNQDLLATSTSERNNISSFAMVQQLGGVFQRVSLNDSFTHKPAFWAVSDFNRDGMIDMLGVPDKGEIALRLGDAYQNNWLGIKLRGRDNRTVYGATVKLRMADGTHYHHRYGLKRSSLDASDREVIFGLGRRSEVSMIEINWPSGKYTRVDAPQLNRHVGFVEPRGGAGDSDVSVRHGIVDYVKRTREQRRTNPGLRFLEPQQQYVCR